jgi:hypothetical protein
MAFFSMVSAFSLPSQVQGVQVQKAGDTSVRVSWNEAESAEDIIIGYKVYFGKTSIQGVGETYDDDSVVYGGIETTIEGLLPNTKYYFAVTALDSEENESANYSAEVEFLLPSSENIPTSVEEPVIPKEISKEIECKLLSEKFVGCEPYTCDFTHPMKGEKLTRTIDGTIDGTCRYREMMPENMKLECRFPEEMQIVMAQYYQKVMKGEETENLIQKALNNKQCYILQNDGLDMFPEVVKKEEVLLEEEMIDPAVDIPKETFGPEKPEEFKPAAPDTIAPIEAVSLLADTKKISADGIVVLSWKKSLDLDHDLVDQILYVREGLGTWDSGYSIGKDIETLELDVQEGKNYEFKVVSVDTAGNRAESRVYSFSTKLAQSGPAGMIGVFVAILVLGVLGLFSARRRA